MPYRVAYGKMQDLGASGHPEFRWIPNPYMDGYYMDVVQVHHNDRIHEWRFYTRQMHAYKQDECKRCFSTVIPADGTIAGYLPAPQTEPTHDEPEQLSLLKESTHKETDAERLNRIYYTCVDMCRQAGLTLGDIRQVTINGRLTASWARCRSHLVCGTVTDHTIEFSKRIFKTQDDTPLVQTMLHELCHTVYGGWHGHTGAWLDATKKLTAMFGINFPARVSYAEYGLS